MVYACEEMVIEILGRLPVKSLVRFTAVCRRWKSIITGPQFRLESSSRRPTKLLVHTDEECLSLEDENHLAVSETADFPFKHWLRKAVVVGSDNGLVCIGIQNPNKKYPSINIIWNPSIRKHAVIPMNPMGEPDAVFADGFGATISGSDYKYVRIVGFTVSSGEDEYSGVDEISTRMAVDVYSWKAGTWRRIFLDYDLYRCRTFWPNCVSLRGRLHWKGTDIDPTSLYHVNAIYAFDLEDEVFEEDIMLPECFSSNRTLVANVFVIRESQLAVIAHENEPRCTVWAMQEYGDVNTWTKLCRVDATAMIDVDFGGVNVEADVRMLLNSMVRFSKNGELLLGLEMRVGLKKVGPPKLVKYNPETSKATDIRGVTSSSSELRGFTNYYKESIVFLTDDDHRVHADHEVLSGARPSMRREALSAGSGPSTRRVRRKLKHHS